MSVAIDRERVKAFWCAMRTYLEVMTLCYYSESSIIEQLGLVANGQELKAEWFARYNLPSASFEEEWCAMRKILSGYRMGDPGSAIRELRDMARYGSDLDRYFPDRIS